VAPPGLGRLVTVLTPVGDQHGVDEAAPGIPFRFWDDDPSCSSTSARYPSTQQVAGSSTDVDSPSAEVAPSVPAPSQLSDLERRKRKEREHRRAARAEHIRSYQAVDVLNGPARLETRDLGRLTMMSGAAKPPSDAGDHGSFTFPSSSDDPNGRFHARPASFGRGRGGLLTPQPRLRHLALASAPPAADRSYSAVTAASTVSLSALPSTPRYTPPPSGMPAPGTPEYLSEVAKMAAVENNLRRSSSKRRGNIINRTPVQETMVSSLNETHVVDSALDPVNATVPGTSRAELAPSSFQDSAGAVPESEGTLGMTPPPASASADTVPESKGTLGVTPPPASASADTVPESKGTLGVTPPPASDQADVAAEQHATVQTAIANADPHSDAAVQLESLSERITIVEQLCEQLGESEDKMNDFDTHVCYVVNTFERTQKAFERTDKLISDVQAETSRMAEVLVELRSDHLADLERHAHLHDVLVKHYVDPRILELAMTQRGQHAELIKRVSHLEKDTVVELNVLQSRIHALETRRHVQPTDYDTVDARATDNEMINAQISALKVRLLDVHQHSAEQWAALDARVRSFEVDRSSPKPQPVPGIASKCFAMASSLTRRLARFILDTRATLATFLAGAVFAIFWTFWLLGARLRPAPADVGSLNMLRCGHVNVPNLLKHGSILKAAADTRGSSLFDGGATHIVHEDDKGAIPGSWQPDVAGLRLGDDTFIPAFGSVLKDFIPPPDVGGPDIRRRVLIAPAVASRVWSGTQEVDMYGSTFVDSPTNGKYLQLKDGRILKLRLASNGLRMLDLRVRPTEAVINTLFAIHPAPSFDSAALCRITGVGKRHLQLAPIEFLRLWHCILGHLSSRRLLATLRHTLVLANVPVLAPDVVKAYEMEHCDVCNAFLQKRASAPALTPVASGVRAETDLPPSVGRALRPLYRILLDVFGPVPWASAQFGYRFVLGLSSARQR